MYFSTSQENKCNHHPPPPPPPQLYFVLCCRAVSRYTKHTINLPWMVINYKTIRILTPEQYNSTIAMQYSVVEMHHLIKKSFF